jgi:arylsulfatase A-like enzyme
MALLKNQLFSHFSIRSSGIIAVSALASATVGNASNKSIATNRYNVLLICVDDLRPELGCMGADYAITPNIDRLAESARLFNHHYVQVPTCGASRFALLTGISPARSHALSNESLYKGRNALKPQGVPSGAQSMPELFRRSGYHTVCIGKVSHTPDGKVFEYNGSGSGRPELPNAWDELATPYGPWKYGWGVFFAYANGRHREDGSGFRPVMQSPDVGDSELPDGMLADAAIKALRANKDRRFFIGLGFIKPHLPFVAPKKYWDMYDETKIPLAANPRRTSAYTHNSDECYAYQFPFKKAHPLADADARKMRHAYLACVSYTDTQVGRVLQELDRLGLSQNTIIILWGDHGWHLGDNGVWGKHTPLEYALRSPLMIRVPDMPQPGNATDALVETIDIYPTLLDICNPSDQAVAHPLDGRSISACISNPAVAGKPRAISYWSGCKSVRNNNYRLIIPTGRNRRPIELYDHRTDPEEAHNIAKQHPETVSKLKKLAQQPGKQ